MNKRAFTLAEVLITLAIIGVVAALTIPVVVRNYQERQIVTSVKKMYSQISQAVNLAQAKEGPIENWGWTTYTETYEGGAAVGEILAPHLKILKKCEIGSDCFGSGYKQLNGDDYTFTASNYCPGYKLADGSFYFVATLGKDCNFKTGTSKELMNTCGSIYVDINGNKKPNTWGKDVFIFNMTKYGVIPAGTKDATIFPFSGCSKQGTGWGCAAWVVAKDNLDYLNKIVSW